MHVHLLTIFPEFFATPLAVGVPKRHRPTAHGVFDIFVPVSVQYVAALALRDKSWSEFRELIVAFGIGVGTSGNKRMGLLL